MSLDSVSHRRLLLWSGEQRATALERLAYGGLTVEQYHYTCGYIKAIDDHMKVLDEIVTELQGE